MSKVSHFPLLVLVIILTYTRSSGNTQGRCRHSPQAMEIMDRLQSSIHSHVPSVLDTSLTNRYFSPVRGTCPTNAPFSDDINLQSLCPWEYYENHDENRYPHNIIYANCTCEICLGSRYRCRPVYHNIPVIRQICRYGEFDFYWDNEQIPVGCTCSHQSPRKKWYLG